MSRTIRGKDKLMKRVRRQIEAVESALDTERWLMAFLRSL